MQNDTKELVNERVFDEVFNSSLSEEEKMFVLYYLESYNVVQSYLKVFGGRRSDALTKSWSLLHKPAIQEQLKNLKRIMQVGFDIDPSRYVEFLLKGANSNIGDYLTFAEEEVPVLDKDGTPVINIDTGEQMIKKVNKIHFTNSKDVDMSLVESVKQGRDGISIQLVDKLKCWEKLRDFMDWKIKKEEDDNTGTNIIEAINNSTKSVWKEEDADKDLEEILDGK